MFQTRSTLPNTILKLSDTQFVVSIFNQAYSMAFKETKRNSKKEFGMDEIAPQLEKLLKPLLMTIELTKESEYLKLSYWAKNHTWKEATILSLEAQNIFYKCVSIQGMVSSLLPILEKQQKQNIIGHIVPISNDAPDFKFIASFHQKTKGVNPGLDITIVKKAEIYQTYTIKQGSTLGGTIAECFTSNVTRNMIGVENTIQMKKVIAPAYLIFRKSKKESKTIEESCKQIWIASEWSNDVISLEACKLFGFDKRTFMAGTFQKELFRNLRLLNQSCQLGLEAVLIAAIYTCDFDLHLENVLLKINISSVPEEKKDSANKLIEQFKKNIVNKQQGHLRNQSSEEKKNNYLEILKNNINKLKDTGAEIYFHKIDHGDGLGRYADPEHKVDLSTHRTSPFYLSKGRDQIKMQPTLHITELTGTDGKGIDQLLLSDEAMAILLKNPLEIQLQTIFQAMVTLFKDIQKAASQMYDLTMIDCHQAEYYLLKEFYFHLRDLDALDDPDLSIKELIEIKKFWIKHYLEMGTLFKVNNLQAQLYARLLEKEQKKENLTSAQLSFKDFLMTQLKSNQALYFNIEWPNISHCYDTGYSELFILFKSNESFLLKSKITKLYELLFDTDSNRNQILLQAYNEVQKYLENNSMRRLGKIITKTMASVCDIPGVQKNLWGEHKATYDESQNCYYLPHNSC